MKPQTQRLVLTRGDNDTVPPELIAAAAGEDDTACPLARLNLIGEGHQIELEEAVSWDAPGRLYQRRVAQYHRIELLYNSPGHVDYAHEISIDARATAATLKRRIAARYSSVSSG